MIKPHPNKAEWFVADRNTAKSIIELPGVEWRQNRDEFWFHRSVLPLLDAPEVGRFLQKSEASNIWLARDAKTEALGFKLRVTQQQAIDYIEARRGTLLGDDPRLGKTLSAIMSHDPARGALVIVAPLSTRAVWLGWCRRAFPEFADRIGVITGRTFNAEVMNNPIIFGHYEVIHRWQSMMKIGTLVFDEAHQLTNPDAKRTIAAVMLQRYAERVIAMTGTPIWNLPPDLWSVVGLVAPGAWGGYHDFSRRYGAPESTGYGNKYTGASNQEELNLRLGEVMLRRRWVDVVEDLPPITRSVVVADLNQAARNKLDILAAKIRTERSNTAGHLASYRRQVTRFKEDLTVREAQKVIGRGDPVVVWTWHKDYAERLGELLKSRFVIHGDILPAKRDNLMAEWKATKNDALIATMPVAQVGIDLSHAPVGIFGEIDWTPAIIGQAEMRTFDSMRLRPMDIIFVVANHIVDQRIVRALIHKLGASNPLGVGAAVDAIDALREAVMGPDEVGDLDRLMEDFLASAT